MGYFDPHYLLKRVIGLMLVASQLTLPVAVIAGNNFASKPKPREVLDRGIEAMGGLAALQSITSRRVVGSIKRMHDGAVGRYELVTQQPGSYFRRISFGNDVEQVAFNQVSAYEWKSEKGLTNLKESDLSLTHIKANYLNGYWVKDGLRRVSGTSKFLLGLASLGTSFFFYSDAAKQNKTPIQLHKPAYSLAFTPAPGVKTAIYFDQLTGRITAEEINETIPRTGANELRKEVFIYDDYRVQKAGILEPYQVRFIRDGVDYEIKVERVVHSEAIDLSQFDVPRETQANLPSIKEVVEKAKANQEKYLSAYDEYQFTSSSSYTEEEPSDGNNMIYSPPQMRDRNKVYEESYYRGFPIWKVVSDSVNNVKEESESRAVDKRKVEIDKLIAEKMPKEFPQLTPLQRLSHPAFLDYAVDIEGWPIYKALQLPTLRNLRLDKLDDRQAFLLDIVPAPGSSSAETYEQLLLSLRGRIWIDTKEFVVLRFEPRSVDYAEYRKLQESVRSFHIRGFKNVIDQKMICEGLWLPSQDSGYSKTTYSNYRRNKQPLNCH